MQTWHIWMEGYASNGDRGGASYEGEVEAETFEEACASMASKRYANLYDPAQNTVWGCRLFPTEREARAVFG